MSKQSQIEALKNRVRKLEMALSYPTLAKEEGFGLFQNMMNDNHIDENVKLLLEHLGLEIQDGKRIVKVTKKGKK